MTQYRLPCSVAVNAYGAFCRTAPSPPNLTCATVPHLMWTVGKRMKTTAGLSTQVAFPSLTTMRVVQSALSPLFHRRVSGGGLLTARQALS